MKVLFDVSALLPKNLNADGIYTKHLYRLLRGIGVDVDPVYKNTYGIKENFIEAHIAHSASKFYGIFGKGNILHGPAGNLISESPKFKKVISINDLSMFRDGIYDAKLAKSLQSMIKQQFQNDPLAVFVPTQEVHNEVLVRYPKMVNKVHIVTPGADHILENTRTVDSKITDKPYFVFKGTIDKKSNLSGVIKAFSGFCAIQDKVQLIVVGDNGHGSDAIHKLVAGSAGKERISFVGYKSLPQLKRIYSDAIATLAPSLYEGFNFSVVEAMKMGCPVLTSGTASLAEVARDAALLVNPKDPEGIMAGMERLYVDQVYRGKLIEAGRERVDGMSWISCAKAVAKVYASL